MRGCWIIIVAWAFANSSFAQVRSPEVTEDNRVIFRLNAPTANKVEIRLESTGTLAMSKEETGIWTVTSEPLEPDFYAYSLVVDGVRMKDPANPLLKNNLFNTESQVHVPGPKTLPWESNDVPHGVVHHHIYRSEVVGRDRPFNRPNTILEPNHPIRCCTCFTVSATRRMPGFPWVEPTSSWITSSPKAKRGPWWLSCLMAMATTR